ncbi:LCP family protein [Butyricicoccus sp.]|uniref:LCP family protein n=1 Tax=Butyricicoccus sp. TaxID=2049021 RepID=UPI003F168808
MSRDSKNNRKNGKNKYYDQYGQPVDEYGRPVDRNGIPYAEYDENGNPPKQRPSAQRRQERPQIKRPNGNQAKKAPQKPKKTRRISIVRVILIALVAVLALVVLDISFLLTRYTYDDTNESSLSANTEDGIMTLALFGVDTRDNGDSGTRADAIMIMSVDPARSSIKLVSLMRDSYVEVPGYGKTKLCHAYGYGGPQLMLQTLNETFDMNITEYMTVDFAQMASIIDAVGGVTVTLTEDELAETNKFIDEYCWENNMPTQRIEAAGEQQLNGIQAMTYGRIRKGNTGGDWQRTERQSIVLNQVFSKATGNPVTLLRFLHGLMPNITSSMSKTDFWYMGLRTVVHGMPSMDHIRLPLEGEWQYGTTSDGMSVIQFNDNVLAQHLHNYIFDDITPQAIED